MLVPEGVKTKFARVITLGEIWCGLSGTKLDLRKKSEKRNEKKSPHSRMQRNGKIKKGSSGIQN